jgi:hypothetical protein
MRRGIHHRLWRRLHSTPVFPLVRRQRHPRGSRAWVRWRCWTVRWQLRRRRLRRRRSFRSPWLCSSWWTRWRSAARRRLPRSCSSAASDRVCSWAPCQRRCCRRRLRAPPRTAQLRIRRARDTRRGAPGRAHAGRLSQRSHTPAARGTVVEVPLGVLVAPRAEAQVLDRPRQPRVRRRQGQHLAHHLQLLARLAIHVDLLGLRRHHHLAAGRRGPQSVSLLGCHRANST